MVQALVHHQLPPAPRGIPAAQAVAAVEAPPAVPHHRQLHQLGVAAGRGRAACRQRQDPGRLLQPAVAIALRSGGHHPGQRRQGTGAQLGAGQIHGHPAGALLGLGGGAHLARQRRPHRRGVMGAVDPAHVHAGAHQLGDQAGVVGGRRRQGHHHGPGAAQQLLTVAVQQGVALLKRHGGDRLPGACAAVTVVGRGAAEALHHADHAVEAGQQVGIAAGEGAQPPPAQGLLQAGLVGAVMVVAVKGHEVEQVAGTGPVRGCHGGQQGGLLLLEGQQLAAQLQQLLADLPQVIRRRPAHGWPPLWSRSQAITRGRDSTFQICPAYSPIERSDEKWPLRAVLRMLICCHRAWSRQARATSS